MKPPSAVLCLTGSELTRGETRDLNGFVIAASLTDLGVRVEEVLLVPDDLDLLVGAVGRAASRADIVIVSGGLGPTLDDRTVEALSRVFDRAVVRDGEAREAMKARALRRGIPQADLPPNFWKQAEVLEGARVLSNPVGLAPGMILETGRGLVAVLPGVPKEMRAMLRQHVLPALEERFHLEPPARLRGKILGVGESWAETRIQKLGIDFDRVEYGVSARPGELLVKFEAREPADAAYLDDVRDSLQREFGAGWLLLEEEPAGMAGLPPSTGLARSVHRLLAAEQVTVATAESCTGGLIAKLLTDNDGSSAYYLGSVVAYHNEVKTSVLGVPADLLKAHGAVSEPVCRAMALGVKKLLASDYALATTGIAGPAGGTAAKPVGLVYIGLAGKDAGPDGGVTVREARLWGDRENVRTLAAARALDLLRRALMKEET